MWICVQDPNLPFSCPGRKEFSETVGKSVALPTEIRFLVCETNRTGHANGTEIQVKNPEKVVFSFIEHTLACLLLKCRKYRHVQRIKQNSSIILVVRGKTAVYSWLCFLSVCLTI